MPSEPITYEPPGPFNIRIERDIPTERVLMEVMHGRGVFVSFVLSTQQARELAANIRDVCS